MRSRKRSRSDFRDPRKNNGETYYDPEFDRDLIAQSIAKQYHILPSEQEELSYSDWSQLLSGLMHDTPLGRVVTIRAETDRKVIERYGTFEKRIRSEWRQFRASQLEHEYTETDRLEVARKFEEMFAKMFG
ncbi:MAG: hypothetical protein IJ723_03385 [Ruminococcus sp.]|nr:hypothetical protein [Ruminococcus sp.]